MQLRMDGVWSISNRNWNKRSFLFPAEEEEDGSTGGEGNQMNNLAGEEAVGHVVALAHTLGVTDTSKYAKPEVDPQHHHLYHLSMALSLFCFSFSTFTLSGFPLQKCDLYSFMHVFIASLQL
ncbi:hypothetical protein INR49_009144 [Caranx melampygus]|nr:hypothetical protein INR49_009144 [Caranx melampygus]